MSNMRETTLSPTNRASSGFLNRIRQRSRPRPDGPNKHLHLSHWLQLHERKKKRKIDKERAKEITFVFKHNWLTEWWWKIHIYRRTRWKWLGAEWAWSIGTENLIIFSKYNISIAMAPLKHNARVIVIVSSSHTLSFLYFFIRFLRFTKASGQFHSLLCETCLPYQRVWQSELLRNEAFTAYLSYGVYDLRVLAMPRQHTGR